MHRIEHHLLNITSLPNISFDFVNTNILNARSTFASNFCLLVYHLSLLMPNVNLYRYFKSLNNFAIVNKVEISPLGTAFECNRFFTLYFFEVAAAAAVLHASHLSRDKR